MSLTTLPRKTNAGLSLNNVFSDFLKPFNDWYTHPEWERALTTPAVNITESEKSYGLTVGAPGLSKEDFKVDLQGNILSITAEKEEKKESKEEDYSRREYNYSSFCRTFTLPQDVKADAIEAQYLDGELRITLPKKEAAAKPTTKVEIK